MTRKDYIAIAAVFKEFVRECKVKWDADDEQKTIIQAELDSAEVLAGRIAAVMAHDNPNFDPKTFFKACGLYTGN